VRRAISLTAALTLWFGRPLAELPPDLRNRVERHFVLSWDMLTAEQRRKVAETFDAQHPTNLADKLAADVGFREGFKMVSIPRRNKLNAKRPRLSRQKVSDADILRVTMDLESEGVKRPKCSEVYKRLFAGRSPRSISSRGFRYRWDRLAEMNKKKGS
jgi:hypothetical protein